MRAFFVFLMLTWICELDAVAEPPARSLHCLTQGRNGELFTHGASYRIDFSDERNAVVLVTGDAMMWTPDKPLTVSYAMVTTSYPDLWVLTPRSKQANEPGVISLSRNQDSRGAFIGIAGNRVSERLACFDRSNE